MIPSLLFPTPLSLNFHFTLAPQELVQLLACGRASSNAFDGERLLDGEARLRGVRATAPVGFLSLFEWCARKVGAVRVAGCCAC